MKKQSSYTKTCKTCGFTSNSRHQWATHKKPNFKGKIDCDLVNRKNDVKCRVGLS